MQAHQEPAYYCQVCDKRLRFKTEEDLERKLQTWCQHTFMHQSGETLDILTCPKCCQLSEASILARYLTRIASGRDMNFH